MAETPLSDPGSLPELAWLPVDKLSVDPRYQRRLDSRQSQNLIDKIATNFRWARFQALLAVEADDGWRVIDGQHRFTAAKRRGIDRVPAVVLPDGDIAEQAAAFIGANRDRVAVSAQALFHAELAAGEPEALTLDRHARAAGIEIVHYRISNAELGTRRTAAVPALRRILRRFGEVTLARSIGLVAHAWRDQAGSLRAPFFMTVALFLNEGGNEKSLREVMPQRDWRELEEAGKLKGGGEYGPARAMLDVLKGWLDATPSVAGAKLGRVASSLPSRAVEPLRPASPAAEPVVPIKPLPGMRFQDDPRAKRDPGSTERLGRAESFGRSNTGSSLA